jgi:hypothetical protein
MSKNALSLSQLLKIVYILVMTKLELPNEKLPNSKILKNQVEE